MALVLLYFVSGVCNASIKYFTPTQWKLVNKILVNPTITTNIRQQLNNIIYVRFEKWAINKAYKFKMIHSYKCRNIQNNELGIYAMKGLSDAITNYRPMYTYNSTIPFLKYASMYINGCLYKGLTELHPITSIPKRVRSRKNAGNKQQRDKVSHLKFIGNNNDDALFENNRNKDDKHAIFAENEYCEIWNKINQLPSQIKRMLHWKYSFEFDILRTDNEVAKLSGCSRETVRKNINQGRYILDNILRKNPQE